MKNNLKKFDYIVYIGRFQPFHNAHAEIIKKAQQLADRVILLIGSHDQPRTIKNPWTSNERHEMIHQALGWRATELVGYIADRKYNDQQWAKDIQNAVFELIKKDTDNISQDGPITNFGRIGIIGHRMDESSEYLEMFPQWKFIEVGSIKGVHATDIRTAYFDPYNFWVPTTIPSLLIDEANKFIKLHVPPIIFNHLMSWRGSNEYMYLDDQYQFIKKYKAAWKNIPYPPIFITTDAVVIQSGHVLLVKRGAQPGKNLWALPGGFVNQHERIKDAMIRELREETRLKVPVPVLKGSITDSKIFDDPYRSLRGRTITHAYLIELNGMDPLPKIKGGDDATKARWIPLSKFEGMQDQMFEDHYDIVHFFLGGV